MGELVRRHIKTALVFLVTGLILGLYMAVIQYASGGWPNPRLITAHVHVLLLGFMLTLIMGVAIWMFPRTSTGGYFSPLAAEISYWLITVGTTLRFLSELLIVRSPASGEPGAFLGALVLVGAAGQVLSVIIFAINIWGRVRPVGRQQ